MVAHARQKVGPDRLLQLSFGGGFAKVSSTPLSFTTNGFNLQAGLGVRTPIRSLRLRLESRAHWYRDAFAGEPYRVPFGVVVDRHEPQKYVLQPLTFGFRF